MIQIPKIGNPALRALSNLGVKYLEDLTKYSEEEISSLHGIGPKAIRILKEELEKNNISFKK